jgi:crossover junction endodeoxyribonuclease RuvC/BirA family biotin operon repressor/biotin-[acetyl-CoA-carboxylase] ligase
MQEKRSIITNAKLLRKESTKAEQMLWQKLRNKSMGIRFRRQHPFDMFIIDFYAPSVKLAIELDGSPHTIGANKEYDETRTDYLECRYIHVLRFWNSEIEKDIEGVLSKIREKIQELSGL